MMSQSPGAELWDGVSRCVQHSVVPPGLFVSLGPRAPPLKRWALLKRPSRDETIHVVATFRPLAMDSLFKLPDAPTGI